MKTICMVYFLVTYLLYGKTKGDQDDVLQATEAQEVFLFPEDVEIVEPPIISEDKFLMYNIENKCYMEDCRLKISRVFSDSDISDPESVVTKFFFLHSVDGVTYAIFDYSRTGIKGEIEGDSYFLVNGQWGHFLIKNHPDYTRLINSLFPDVQRAIGIDDKWCVSEQ